MTFGGSSWPDQPFVRVFLDANVLAKPVTRTLFLLTSLPSRFVVVWSATAEEQADRHRREGAISVGEIRRRLGIDLSPTGAVGARFQRTHPDDRQILADAISAEALFLVSDNIRDFAEPDLVHTGLSVSQPDVFLSTRATAEAYGEALRFLEATRRRPAHTVGQLHDMLQTHHPRLVDRFSVNGAGKRSGFEATTEVFRGRRCLRCLRLIRPPSSLADGRCSGSASSACRLSFTPT
jgi:hypothetical protein